MNFFTNSKYIVLLLILTANISFGQLDTSIIHADTLKLMKQSEYQIKLSNSNQIHSPLFSIKHPMIFDTYSQFILPSIDPSPAEENISMMQLRNEINQTMNIYRQGQNKYQLGVVGDILGYVSAAAAAGIAIHHVHKYKKYYSLK